MIETRPPHLVSVDDLWRRMVRLLELQDVGVARERSLGDQTRFELVEGWRRRHRELRHRLEIVALLPTTNVATERVRSCMDLISI